MPTRTLRRTTAAALAIGGALGASIGVRALLAGPAIETTAGEAPTGGAETDARRDALPPNDVVRENIDEGAQRGRAAQPIVLDLPPPDAAEAAAARAATETATSEAAPAPSSPLVVPDGYSATIYADGLAGARSLAISPAGTLFVGSRFDRVYAIADDDRDGSADRVTTIARRLDAPAGVAFADGALYVVEPTRVLRFDDIERRLDLPPDPVVVSESLPNQRFHRLRSARFGPDRALYVAIGAPCDACRRQELLFATISRFRFDFGGDPEPFAEGVRGSFGFDWHPVTGELWMTDQGRGGLGDDWPVDEIDRASRIGLHFGFPWCYGAAFYDDSLRELTHTRCDFFTVPELELPAKTGPMGMRFYTAAMLPGMQGAIILAEGGPEEGPDRFEPRVAIVRIGDRTSVRESLVTGWTDAATGEAWGRPVDVEQLADGALAISDERTGAVWRVSYGE